MRGYQLLRIAAAIVAISACIIGAFADSSGYCGKNVRYYLIGTELIINGTGNMTNYDREDTAPWYYRSCSVTKVTIQDNVTSVGTEAFKNCINLTSVTLGKDITLIGNSAFYGCSNLTSLTIPAATIRVNDVFAYCHKLQEIKVEQGNSNYTAVNGVLFNKDKTTLLRFPCGKGTSYDVPSPTSVVATSAFTVCQNLKKVTFASSVKEIGTGAFSGCSNLTQMTLPDSLETIRANAFNGCTSLTSVKIPSHVTDLGEGAFTGCSNLTSVDLQASITEIKKSTFSNCKSLASFVIPEGITTLGNSSFSGCTSLSSVSFPKSLKNLGSSIFYNTGFVHLKYPVRLGVVAPSMFAYSKYLKTVVIPEGITRIGEGAFRRCSALLNATISSTVTEIGQSAFGENQEMNDIFVHKCNPVYTDVDGVLFTKDKKTLLQYPGDHMSVYTIPEGTTTIGPYAFQYLGRWFNKINFSSTVTTVGRGAFQDNGGITELVLPSNMVNFGYECFYNTWVRTVLYLGLHDPDPLNQTHTFYCTDYFSQLCVPIDYQDDTCFGRAVFAKNSSFDYLRGIDNACYHSIVCTSYSVSRDCNAKITYSTSTGHYQKRPATFDWTRYRSKCSTHLCYNDTGNAQIDDKCNHTLGEVCVDDKCVIPPASSSGDDSSSCSVPVVTSSSSSDTPVTPSSSSHTPVTPSSSSDTPVTPSSSSHTPVTPSSSSHTPVTPSSSSVTPVTPSSSRSSMFIASSVRSVASYMMVVMMLVVAFLN